MNLSRLLIRTIALCCLLILQPLSVAFAENQLAAFEANYIFYYGKSKVANAKIKLTQSADIWNWRLTTDPTGLLSLLTSKEPYSETTFSRTDGSHEIQNIVIADDGEGDKQLETAKFDWSSKQVDMLRKDVPNNQSLTGEVYDYLTIHLLSAKLQEQGLQQFSVDFYYKGRLVKAELKQLENTRLKINKEEVDVVVMEQTVEGSGTKSTYYYNPETPYLPMKIETAKSGKTGTTLLFQSVQ
jgi:hypothetical protein